MKPLPGHLDYHTLDRWTLVHGAFGLGFGLARLPWWSALALAAGWEVVEYFAKPYWRGMLFQSATQDTPENVVTDIAAVVMGWAVGYRLTDGSYPLTWAKLD